MKDGLQSKIIYRASFLTAAITLISFIITFYFSYEVSVSNGKLQVNNILDAIEQSASVGIYAANEAIAEDVIAGLLRSDLICSVEIRDADGKIIHAQAKKGGADCGERLERKVGSPFDRTDFIGSIQITVNHGSLVRLSRDNSIINSAITALSLIVAAAICIMMVSRWIIRPLLGISVQLQAISGRRDMRIVSGIADGELSGLVDDINTLLDHRDAAEDVILQQLNYDPLTELPNRRLLRDRLETAINLSQRNDSKVAVMLMDLDGFKEVNDQFGHDVGDKLLILATERMVKAVRKSDTVARLGGDEFAVILPDIRQSWQAEGVAEQLLQVIDAPFSLAAATAHVSASIGLTWFPDDGDSTETLMKYADQAMYSAKAAGGNRFHWFTAELQHAAAERHLLTLDLRTALQNDQLAVHYQPIVDLATGEIVNAEALLRWNHPTRGPIPPADFISLAEASGLILPIGDWVFRRAAAIAKQWVDWARQAGRDAGSQSVHISVNTSSRQFQMGFEGSEWLAYLAEIGLSAQHITIEITESLFLGNDQEITATLDRLRREGMLIAIDDFGTGYSSLGYLQKLPIDYIKIDRSFINNIDTSESGKAIVDAILALAQKLNLSVVAEGIERENQMDFLRHSGCEFGQGWLMYKPMSEADFKTLLQKRLSSPVITTPAESPP